MLEGLIWGPGEGLTFSLRPPATAGEQIRRRADDVLRDYRLAGPRASEGQLRLDLFGLGGLAAVPRAFVAQSLEDAARLRPQAGFDFELDHVATVRAPAGRLVVLAGSEPPGLAALREDLARALVEAGLGRWVPPAWTPRVVLAASMIDIPTTPVEPVVWRVDELVLIHVLRDGARQLELGRWPLIADDGPPPSA